MAQAIIWLKSTQELRKVPALGNGISNTIAKELNQLRILTPSFLTLMHLPNILAFIVQSISLSSFFNS